MDTIARVCDAMTNVLTVGADAAGRASGLVRRQSKVTGSIFTRTLVFGWLKHPQASFEELTQTTASLGVQVSPQGLEQRMGPAATACLKRVLEAAVGELIATEPVAIPVLQRFHGVFLVDSSTVVLPDALASVWSGCSGSTSKGTRAALKLQVLLDLNTGRVGGPLLQDGKAQDRNAPIQEVRLPAGALRLADMGYFSLRRFAALSHEGVYWLSRLQVGTVVLDQDHRRLDLDTLLGDRKRSELDLQVFLGAEQRVPCRLLATRVPPEVAKERRRKLRYQAKRKRQAVSKRRLRLADWTMLVTNIPAALLSLKEALVLARARWQIELLFKLWKSHGQIDQWRSANPEKILMEVYAKLLAMLIEHWILLAGCWSFPNRSLVKAAQTVRDYALMLACATADVLSLPWVLRHIQRCLAAGCRMNPRAKRPNTYQLLLALNNSS